MAKIARGTAGLVGGVIGLVLSLGGTAGYVYFLWTAARLSHWVAFIGGMVVPPLGALGGLLAFLGVIWQDPASISATAANSVRAAQPPPVQRNASYDSPPSQKENTSTVFAVGVYLGLQAKCSWTEFNSHDLKAATLVRSASQNALRRSGTSEDDLTRLDGMADGVVKTTKCTDERARKELGEMTRGLRDALGAAAYDQL